MGLVRFELDISPGGGKVVLDGVDVSEQVVALRLDHEARAIPHLMIEVAGEGRITGDGTLEVARRQSDAQVIADFLESIDPETLEKEVLTSLGWGENGTAAVLRRLVELARDA